MIQILMTRKKLMIHQLDKKTIWFFLLIFSYNNLEPLIFIAFTINLGRKSTFLIPQTLKLKFAFIIINFNFHKSPLL